MRSLFPEIRAGHIEMRDVTFRYPSASPATLSPSLNLKIKPGERIGIIGRVASGKSTLGRVLCGLYPPTGGEMTIDGLDSRQYHPAPVARDIPLRGQERKCSAGRSATI